ncbi:MAG: hypothetical protein C0472_03925 [Erythrobacter sp.]|nr:hypothetical protein [Erythrobacter sp.]
MTYFVMLSGILAWIVAIVAGCVQMFSISRRQGRRILANMQWLANQATRWIRKIVGIFVTIAAIATSAIVLARPPDVTPVEAVSKAMGSVWCNVSAFDRSCDEAGSVQDVVDRDTPSNVVTKARRNPPRSGLARGLPIPSPTPCCNGPVVVPPANLLPPIYQDETVSQVDMNPGLFGLDETQERKALEAPLGSAGKMLENMKGTGLPEPSPSPSG